jgi:hypothetical protein
MLLGGTTDLNITFPSSGFGEINTGTQGLDIIASSGNIRTRTTSTYTLLSGNFFGIGRTPGARLDVQAQGALSSDLAFRVRNSADTATIMYVNGLGNSFFRSSQINADYLTIGVDSGGSIRDAFKFSSYIQNLNNRTWTFDAGTNGNNEGLKIYNDLTGNDQGILSIRQNNLLIGYDTVIPTISDRRTVVLFNGVAPTTSMTDSVKFYSADANGTAGAASPHFRTEDGSIIWLGTQSRLFNVTASSITSSFTGSLTGSVTNYETAWTPYTPAWTTDGVTQPVIGNGSVTGAYKQIGKTVFVRVKLNCGSTTTFGTGAWQFGLPVTASNADGIQFPCSILENSVAWFGGTVNGTYSGATFKSAIITPQPFTHTQAAVTATSPFTWGDTDSLQFNGTYESI